jgi:hypothetical protein
LELKYPELMLSQNVDNSPARKKEQNVDNMSNQNCFQEVVLQTLKVKLMKDNGNEQK